MSSFVLCARANEDDKFIGEPGPLTYLEVPADMSVPLPSHAMNDATSWFKKIVQLANPGNITKKLDIVFFVHGYNTDPHEALLRQRLVEAELNQRNFPCMVVGFDWPTGGSALDYEHDRSRAVATAGYLVSGGIIPFVRFNQTDCPVNVHVMAHSMGAFVVREGFRMADKIRDPQISTSWRISQMVLFAADVSSECFELDHPDMVPVFDHCGRLTNYFSGHDEALMASNVKNMDIESRVGRVGMPVDTPAHEKALDVNCSDRYAYVPDRSCKKISGMKSHSWYLEDEVWYDDLAIALSGKMDRNLIPTRTWVGHNDFELMSHKS